MEILISIIALPCLILGIFSSVTMAVNSSGYKYYKKTFQALSNAEYRLAFRRYSGDMVIFVDDLDKNQFIRNEIILFENGFGSIKLLGSYNYIHTGTSLFFDPYTYYWYKKIQKWYFEHKEILKKEEVVWYTIKKQKR